jgi:hypothetical protein
LALEGNWWLRVFVGFTIDLFYAVVKETAADIAKFEIGAKNCG